METTPTVTPTRTRLLRSTSDKVVAGVCGGLARYFALDPAVVRLAFVVFALAGGASILLYIVLWIATPDDGGVPSAPAVSAPSQETLAFALIAIGGLWLLANLGAFTFINWRLGWPIVFIVLGLALLWRRVRP